MTDLIPYPTGGVQLNKDVCPIPRYICADLGGFARWSVIAFENRMKRSVVEGGSWLRLFRDPGKAREGYAIGITSQGVCIGAADEIGVIWALTTLVQLVKEDTLPCGLLQDAPQNAHRSLELDCKQRFCAASEMKKIIEQISLRKINVLRWRIRGNQTDGQRQMLDLVEYARLRGVEVFVEIDDSPAPKNDTAVRAGWELPYSMLPLRRVYRDGSTECFLRTRDMGTYEQLEMQLFPRMLAFSEVCWSGAGDYAAFCSRAEAVSASPFSAGISFTPKVWWDPRGRARRKEAMAFLSAYGFPTSGTPGEKTGFSCLWECMTAHFPVTDWPFVLMAWWKGKKNS